MVAPTASAQTEEETCASGQVSRMIDWSKASLARFGTLPVIRVSRKRSRAPTDVVLVEEQPQHQRRRIDGDVASMAAQLSSLQVGKRQESEARGHQTVPVQALSASGQHQEFHHPRGRRVVLRRVATGKAREGQDLENQVLKGAKNLNEQASRVARAMRAGIARETDTAAPNGGTRDHKVPDRLPTSDEAVSSASQFQQRIIGQLKCYGEFQLPEGSRDARHLEARWARGQPTRKKLSNGRTSQSQAFAGHEQADRTLYNSKQSGLLCTCHVESSIPDADLLAEIDRAFLQADFSGVATWLRLSDSSAPRQPDSHKLLPTGRPGMSLRCNVASFVHPSSGITFLMAATRHKRESMCAALLQHGASPVLCSAEGLDCSEYARKFGHSQLEAILDAAGQKWVSEGNPFPRGWAARPRAPGVIASHRRGDHSKMTGSSIVPGSALAGSSRRHQPGSRAQPDQITRERFPSRGSRGVEAASEEEEEDDDEEEDIYVVDPLGTMLASGRMGWSSAMPRQGLGPAPAFPSVGTRSERDISGCSAGSVEHSQRSSKNATPEGFAAAATVVASTSSSGGEHEHLLHSADGSMWTGHGRSNQVSLAASQGSSGSVYPRGGGSPEPFLGAGIIEHEHEHAGQTYPPSLSADLQPQPTLQRSKRIRLRNAWGLSSSDYRPSVTSSVDSHDDTLHTSNHTVVPASPIGGRGAPLSSSFRAFGSRHASNGSLPSVAHNGGGNLEYDSSGASRFGDVHGLDRGSSSFAVGGTPTPPVSTHAAQHNLYFQAAYGDAIAVATLPDQAFVEIGEFAQGSGAFGDLYGWDWGQQDSEAADDLEGSVDENHEDYEGNDYPDEEEGNDGDEVDYGDNDYDNDYDNDDDEDGDHDRHGSQGRGRRSSRRTGMLGEDTSTGKGSFDEFVGMEDTPDIPFGGVDWTAGSGVNWTAGSGRSSDGRGSSQRGLQLGTGGLDLDLDDDKEDFAMHEPILRDMSSLSLRQESSSSADQLDRDRQLASSPSLGESDELRQASHAQGWGGFAFGDQPDIGAFGDGRMESDSLHDDAREHRRSAPDVPVGQPSSFPWGEVSRVSSGRGGSGVEALRRRNFGRQQRGRGSPRGCIVQPPTLRAHDLDEFERDLRRQSGAVRVTGGPMLRGYSHTAASDQGVLRGRDDGQEKYPCDAVSIPASDSDYFTLRTQASVGSPCYDDGGSSSGAPVLSASAVPSQTSPRSTGGMSWRHYRTHAKGAGLSVAEMQRGYARQVGGRSHDAPRGGTVGAAARGDIDTDEALRRIGLD